MGIKSFLQKQGFIQESSGEAGIKKETPTPTTNSTPGNTTVTPTYFPIASSKTETAEPSFVEPLSSASGVQEKPDPSFVKFFEDELMRTNLTGNDYMEFRQLLHNMQAKMAGNDTVNNRLILQTAMSSFEAQGVTKDKLLETARYYKTAIQKKNDEFLSGAATEKNNQLQNRQGLALAHDNAIKKLQQQIQDLEAKKKQLEESVNQEKTQAEADKSIGQEGIIKIERAEKMIVVAYNYMQATIDNDINQIESL